MIISVKDAEKEIGGTRQMTFHEAKSILFNKYGTNQRTACKSRICQTCGTQYRPGIPGVHRHSTIIDEAIEVCPLCAEQGNASTVYMTSHVSIGETFSYESPVKLEQGTVCRAIAYIIRGNNKDTGELQRILKIYKVLLKEPHLITAEDKEYLLGVCPDRSTEAEIRKVILSIDKKAAEKNRKEPEKQ